MPRYCAAVDSRLTSTTLRPAAAPRNFANPVNSSGRPRSNPVTVQSPVAAVAPTLGSAVVASAIHAFRSAATTGDFSRDVGGASGGVNAKASTTAASSHKYAIGVHHASGT